MSEHTAGPWLVMDGSTHACKDDLVGLGKRHFNVYANSFGVHVHHVAMQISEDDARLIAAAPELLEALRFVRERAENSDLESYIVADKAIAKAT